MKLQSSTLHFLTGLFIITGITSCNEPNKGKTKSGTSISGETKLIAIDRFERKLFAERKDFSVQLKNYKSLYKDYPDMLAMYSYLMRIPAKDTFNIAKQIYNVYVDSVFEDVQKQFGDAELLEIENQLNDAFSKTKEILPKDTLPKIYTTLSLFGASVFPLKHHSIWIALDLFLGTNYRYYNSLEYPGYIRYTFQPQFIVPLTLKSWFYDTYDEQELTDKTLLSHMIYSGKRLYYLDQVCPDMEDSLKILYKTDQMKWCKDNEGLIWQHFADSKILYMSNQEKIDRYMTEANTTLAEGLPPEAAPRLGEFIGWQIVKSYMKNHPDVTPEQLFLNKNYKEILSSAKYKPEE